MQLTIGDDLIKRLEDIEYFILKKKKNDPKHPTLIDLTNERVSKLDSEVRELIGQVRIQVD